MRYLFDLILMVLLIALIHSVYQLGDKLVDVRPATSDGAQATGFYRCGKNKRGDVYCPINIKGD